MGKVNSDTLESLQHRAAKLIVPNSGLHTKELIAALGLVPLTNTVAEDFTLSC